jgi:hypothetical protein
MRSKSKSISLLLMLLLAISLSSIDYVIAQAPSTTISIESPNSTIIYGDTIPITFKVFELPNQNISTDGSSWVTKVSYVLDDKQPIDIMNFGHSWGGGYSTPIQNTTYLYNESDGQHKLQLTGEGYYTNVIGVYGYNFSSPIVYFTVDTSPSPSATPTPSVPEFPILAIIPLFLAVVSIPVIIKLKKKEELKSREK